MISINNYNRKDLMASCSAANIMNKSYSKNGLYGKALKERYKLVKSKNNEIQDKLGSKTFIGHAANIAKCVANDLTENIHRETRR